MSLPRNIAAETVQTFTSQVPGSLWSLLVSIIVVYSVAAHYPEGRAAIGGLVMVGSSMLQERVDNGVDYLFIVILFGGTWLLGRASRLWRMRIGHAEQHQHDLARLAVAEERLRIARELHDVVAHSLSIIAVQADAAEADSGELRPVPALNAIEELIANVRESGLTVKSSVEGIPGAVPPAVDLAAYRIVQEALTNVARHAGPVAAAAVIRYTTGNVELEVSNGPGQVRPNVTSAGVGLLGIRERVALLGGTLQASDTSDGGYLLRAELPLDGSPR